MKKLLLALLGAAALAAPAKADVSAMTLGYVNGQVRTQTTSGFSSKEKDTNVSGAIFIPAEEMKMFAGNHIDQVNAGLASTLNIDELTVWIRTSLDGENLASGSITKETDPAIQKGWNAVNLATPYDITENAEGIYIGYTYHQTGAAVGMSVFKNTLMPTQENACFVKLGTDAEWEDRHLEATICIEALVYGDNLPKHNLRMTSLEVSPIFVVDKGKLDVKLTAKNMATVTISKFDVLCEIDGISPITTTINDARISYQEEKEFEFSIKPEGITTDAENRDIKVTIVNLAEGEDENPDDNFKESSFEVVQHDFSRRVLIEEFTTEQCPNCPRVGNFLHEYLENKDNAAKVTTLCHHSGYYTDWLTISSDNDYLWLFNMGGSTFAPAVMIDRAVDPVWSNQSEVSPIFMPSSAEHIGTAVEARLKAPALVSVAVKAAVEDDMIKVTVSGERVRENFTEKEPRIVVALSEDNIKARSQAGSSGTWIHQHVSRAVNSAWGVPMEWDGNNYEYQCEFKMENSYVPENLVVVAYIWDYDSKNAGNCEVANSNEYRFSEEGDTGVDTLFNADEEAVATDYYTIDGVRLSAPVKGLNIVRYSNGETKKVFIR